MKIATFNINGIKARLPRLIEWLGETQPDVVCLQELKSTDETLPVREVRLSAGAGFVVAICGDVMTMPGLPRVPAADHMRLDANGLIQGLS